MLSPVKNKTADGGSFVFLTASPVDEILTMEENRQTNALKRQQDSVLCKIKEEFDRKQKLKKMKDKEQKIVRMLMEDWSEDMKKKYENYSKRREDKIKSIKVS